ncbi:organic cation/carnitine transporter 7-like [Salvia splendens]|uniref:organic cation/carnitine transporter 7-like n=1 Tax=Salvia splendens TaxID=180675 RepID=UPI001C279734|nr:organic cation/carnitine transporter 7-like [Salvia splendens]
MVQMGDSELVYTLDEALAMVGFGKFQGLLLAYGGVGYIADAMEIMILSFIGAAVEAEWHLSPGEKSLISTVVFAGMLVGSYVCGVISDAYGRKKGILCLAIVTSVAGLLSAFSPNYASLLVFRCLAGAGLGGMHTFTTWFLEFIPAPNRGVWMIVFSSFWTVGTIFEAGLAWIVMPKLGWRWLLAFSAVPCFVILLLYRFVPESPRLLCMKGKFEEAHGILERAARVNGTTLQNGTLVLDHIKDDNEFAAAPEDAPVIDEVDNHKSSPSTSTIFLLFSPKLITTTLALWFLFFGNTFSYYGVILLTSELSSGGSKCTPANAHSNQSQHANLYLDVFITSLAEVPGLIVAAFIVDRVGRKLSMIIMFVVASILLIPLLTHQIEATTTALLFGARALVSATFIVACIYAPEVYPTSIRGTAVGLTTAIGRIGGMICPLVAVALVAKCQQTYAVILFQVVILGCALSVFLSPFETKGKNLVDVLQNK